LGLAISAEDAKLHGGWLEAWGSPGQGAQFRLTLPAKAGSRLTSSPLSLIPTDFRPPEDSGEPEQAGTTEPAIVGDGGRGDAWSAAPSRRGWPAGRRPQVRRGGGARHGTRRRGRLRGLHVRPAEAR